MQWQLTHQDLDTPWSYVQELPLSITQAALTREQQQRVGRLSGAANLVLRRTLGGLEGSPIAQVPSIALRRRSVTRSSCAPPPTARGGVESSWGVGLDATEYGSDSD